MLLCRWPIQAVSRMYDLRMEKAELFNNYKINVIHIQELGHMWIPFTHNISQDSSANEVTGY
jgi:hypothetical protein